MAHQQPLPTHLALLAQAASNIPTGAIEWAVGQADANAVATCCSDYGISREMAAILLCCVPHRLDLWLFAKNTMLHELRPIDVLRDYEQGEACLRGALLGGRTA